MAQRTRGTFVRRHETSCDLTFHIRLAGATRSVVRPPVNEDDPPVVSDVNGRDNVDDTMHPFLLSW